MFGTIIDWKFHQRIPASSMLIDYILIKFSEKGDYHFYGFDEMQKLFIKNDLSPLSSQKTGENTYLHIGEKYS